MIRLCYPCVFSPLPRSTFPPFPFLSSEHHVRQLTTSLFWKHPLPLARNTYSPDFLYVSGSPQFPFFAHTSPLGVIPESITGAFSSHVISLLRHSHRGPWVWFPSMSSAQTSPLGPRPVCSKASWIAHKHLMNSTHSSPKTPFPHSMNVTTNLPVAEARNMGIIPDSSFYHQPCHQPPYPINP